MDYKKIPYLGSFLAELIEPDAQNYRRYGEEADRTRRLLAQGFSLLTLLSGLGYLAWLVWSLDPTHPIVGGLFLAAEIGALILFITTATSNWTLRFKRPEGLEVEGDYDVDLFVTVCGEPLSIVRRTLEAAAEIRPVGDLKLHVLDDGGSDDVKALAEELGFHYISRAEAGVEQQSGKAGNLNFGLERSENPFVLVLDVDQIAEPDLLEVIAGYMRFDDVGFVQTKQSYFVQDGDPFFNHDAGFYDAVQLSFDADDTVISCGSGVLYRREALEDIGGFAEWNVVEDLTTSYELHSNGWKSFYYPYAKSKGMAPDTIQDFYKQRSGWALDTMRLFFWDNPLFKDGLSWKKARDYLVISVSYLTSGFLIPIFFLVPLWTYLTGNTFLARPEWEFFIIRAIYFVFMAFGMHYLLRRQNANRQFRAIIGLFPVFIRETFRALFYPPGKEIAQAPNNTSWAPHNVIRAAWAVSPQLLIVAANAILPFYAAWAGTASDRILLTNALISTFALWTLFPILYAALADHEWDPEEKPENVYNLERRRGGSQSIGLAPAQA